MTLMMGPFEQHRDKAIVMALSSFFFFFFFLNRNNISDVLFHFTGLVHRLSSSTDRRWIKEDRTVLTGKDRLVHLNGHMPGDQRSRAFQ